MKLYLVLIFFSISILAIQETFGQENEMTQEGFMHFPVGEKFFQYKTDPPLALVEEIQNRCWFISTFVNHEDSGRAFYQFPKDMIWPGGNANSTFFIITYQANDFVDEKVTEKIFPQYSEDDLILNFEIKNGVSQLLVNSTTYFESDNNTPRSCRPLFDVPPDSIDYYDKIFPPRVQQYYADSFGFSYDVILCKSDRQMVTKIDGSLACVAPETKTKLIQRGWIVTNFDLI